ncbi:hypothetical protein [Rugosimonospora africana]|uniref:Concanavalin A-like lectin/glucanase superfamily protein n=1 Tax=Rugosimonospora africana TaxID=556532 RepID=A0A8J3QUZ4_9ACTN|nr:hypothetical protein [Rugosimonospora africana]GIH16253.1 hypothetical protein Raf01_44250 [Rugosimonospora africana]
MPIVSLQASGTLRRLIQRNKPLKSALYRAISASNLVQWWPLEDGIDATQAASGLAGGAPMRVDIGIMDFIDGGPVGGAGAAQPNVAADNNMSVPLVGLSATAWHVSLWMRGEPDDPGSVAYFVPLEVRTDNGKIYRVVTQWQSGTVNVGIARYESEADASESHFAGLDLPVMDGNWHLHQIALAQSGSNVSVTFVLDGDSTDAETWTGVTLGQPVRATRIGRFGGGGEVSSNAKNLAVAHIAFFNGTTMPDQYAAGLGYVGEAAVDRLTRLCAEEGVPIDITQPDSDPGVAMGPQGVDTFVNLLRECEASDQGLLYDGLGPGLGYIARTSTYNQPVTLILDASQGDIAPPFTPTDDDQGLVNKATVSRKGGSSATYEVVDGPLGTDTIGTYDASKTLSLFDDSRLQRYAEWLAQAGTVEGFRYPNLSLNLRSRPARSDAWLDTPLNGRIDATNVIDATKQHPPGDVSLLLQGYGETASSKKWTVAGNTSPAQSRVVAALNTSFRLEAVGQTLASSLAPGATSLSLATAAGHALFSTTAQYPADFPSDLDVGGWQIRVTGASGSSSPQTLDIEASANTVTIPAGATVKLWRPAGLAL